MLEEIGRIKVEDLKRKRRIVKKTENIY